MKTIIMLITALVVISCKNNTSVPENTETAVFVESDTSSVISSLPLLQDRLDTLVENVLTRLQNFIDTNQYFKDISVVSYAELKDIRGITGQYKIFTRYDCKNVWDEVEYFSDVYSLSIALEDHKVADTSWSSDDGGDYMHVSKNFIKKGEIVVKVGGEILFHTKSLEKAQLELYEELQGSIYGPSHQPPVHMRLTAYSSRAKGKMF